MAESDAMVNLSPASRDGDDLSHDMSLVENEDEGAASDGTGDDDNEAKIAELISAQDTADTAFLRDEIEKESDYQRDAEAAEAEVLDGCEYSPEQMEQMNIDDEDFHQEGNLAWDSHTIRDKLQFSFGSGNLTGCAADAFNLDSIINNSKKNERQRTCRW